MDVTVAIIEVDWVDESIADTDIRDESVAYAVANEDIVEITLVDADNDIRLVRVMRELEVACTDTLPFIVDV